MWLFTFRTGKGTERKGDEGGENELQGDERKGKMRARCCTFYLFDLRKKRKRRRSRRRRRRRKRRQGRGGGREGRGGKAHPQFARPPV